MFYLRQQGLSSTGNDEALVTRALIVHAQYIELKFVADKFAKPLELEYKDILTQNKTEDLVTHKYIFFDDFTH